MTTKSLDDCTITVVSETGSQIGILTESRGALRLQNLTVIIPLPMID